MLKCYVKDHNTLDGVLEVKVFDTDKQTMKGYHMIKDGFKFGNESTYNVSDMGYDNVNHAIKSLKSRKQLGSQIEYMKLKELEKIGYIKLGVQRIERSGRVNTKDFEDVIVKLQAYGMGFCDAQNAIISEYLNA